MYEQAKPPGLINWTGYFALTLFLILPLSVITVRSGAWQQGLLLYAIACFGSFLLLLIAIVLVLLPRFGLWRSAIAKRALFTVPGSILLLSLLAGGNVPPIHDITTDIDDPPTFAAAETQRGATSNSLEIDEGVLAQQREAYADLQTLTSAQAFDESYDRALQVAIDLGWDVYHQDRNAGVIEAVDTTAIMAFKDDIVIRIRTNAEGSLIDLRSVSRVGESDIGANAQRIRAFIQAFQQAG